MGSCNFGNIAETISYEININKKEETGHNSVQDAQAAMKLYTTYMNGKSP